jgi:hypothetical protein
MRTPGKWEVCKNFAWAKKIDIRRAGDWRNIAFVSSLNEDDARLIAAAPEMLAALKEFILWEQSSKEHGKPRDSNILISALTKAYSSIRAAEGEK